MEKDNKLDWKERLAERVAALGAGAIKFPIPPASEKAPSRKKKDKSDGV